MCRNAHGHQQAIQMPTSPEGQTLSGTRKLHFNFNEWTPYQQSDVNSQVTSYVYNTPPSDCSSSDGLDA